MMGSLSLQTPANTSQQHTHTHENEPSMMTEQRTRVRNVVEDVRRGGRLVVQVAEEAHQQVDHKVDELRPVNLQQHKRMNEHAQC